MLELIKILVFNDSLSYSQNVKLLYFNYANQIHDKIIGFNLIIISKIKIFNDYSYWLIKNLHKNNKIT